MQGPVDSIRRSNICATGVTEGEARKKKKVQQRIFEEKKKEQVRNLQIWRKMNLQIQEEKQIPYRIGLNTHPGVSNC